MSSQWSQPSAVSVSRDCTHRAIDEDSRAARPRAAGPIAPGRPCSDSIAARQHRARGPRAAAALPDPRHSRAASLVRFAVVRRNTIAHASANSAQWAAAENSIFDCALPVRRYAHGLRDPVCPHCMVRHQHACPDPVMWQLRTLNGLNELISTLHFHNLCTITYTLI